LKFGWFVFWEQKVGQTRNKLWAVWGALGAIHKMTLIYQGDNIELTIWYNNIEFTKAVSIMRASTKCWQQVKLGESWIQKVSMLTRRMLTEKLIFNFILFYFSQFDDYIKYGWVTNLFIMEILWFDEFYPKKAVFSWENVPKFLRNLNSGNHDSPGKWTQVPQEIMVSKANSDYGTFFFNLSLWNVA
jgi:hypothetical protein